MIKKQKRQGTLQKQQAKRISTRSTLLLLGGLGIVTLYGLWADVFSIETKGTLTTFFLFSLFYIFLIGIGFLWGRSTVKQPKPKGKRSTKTKNKQQNISK